MITGKYPSLRLRRNRKFDWTRRLIRENDLSSNDLILPIFLTEKESSQIGKVLIPNGLLTELKKERHVRLTCSLTTRVTRLTKEYINEENDDNQANLRTHISYLKRLISTEELEEFLALFDQKSWSLLLEKILTNYYDKVYKKCAMEPIAEVSHEDTSEAMNTVINLYKKQKTER